MARPGSRQPHQIAVYMSQQEIDDIDRRAIADGILRGGSEPNRSELVRIMVAYAIDRMPSGWRPGQRQIRHGTRTAYTYGGCRCDDCRAEHRRYNRAMRARLRARAQDAPHGTMTGYQQWGCRCEACRAAGAAAWARRSHNDSAQ